MKDKLKYRWSLANNYMAGITFGCWWRLLRETGFAVDPVYWHRGAAITATSLLNSFWRMIEQIRFARKIEQTTIAHPPLFVLGHWRSGTTHLHNLLSLDPQFAYPNTFQVVSPHTFLSTEKISTRMFKWMVPDTRPMDNMEIRFSSPQEDEFAILLDCLKSLYFSISFPREERYEQHLTFEDAPPEDVEAWKASLLWFVKKLTLKYDRPIVLKSPPHTARIKMILDVFPDANFVHIHRDPYAVFRSTQHYFDTAVWYTYLQRPDRSKVDDGIINRYRVMHDAFFEQRELIPVGHFHEMAYDDLADDPVGQLTQMYEALNIDGFDAYEPKLRKYLDSISDYKRNRFDDLPDELRSRIAGEWQRCFNEWNYPT